MSLNQEAETGGAALHDKWQCGHICTAVMPKNRCLVDDCGDHCRKTDELCSTISIGEASVMASIEKACLFHQLWSPDATNAYSHTKRPGKQLPPFFCASITMDIRKKKFKSMLSAGKIMVSLLG
jgi:hypothetical protein